MPFKQGDIARLTQDYNVTYLKGKLVKLVSERSSGWRVQFNPRYNNIWSAVSLAVGFELEAIAEEDQEAARLIWELQHEE